MSLRHTSASPGGGASASGVALPAELDAPLSLIAGIVLALSASFVSPMMPLISCVSGSLQ
eukprot:12864599-Heterocapsa_arctica.AAC.1